MSFLIHIRQFCLNENSLFNDKDDFVGTKRIQNVSSGIGRVFWVLIRNHIGYWEGSNESLVTKEKGFYVISKVSKVVGPLLRRGVTWQKFVPFFFQVVSFFS